MVVPFETNFQILVMKIPVGFEEGNFTLEVNYVPLKIL